jgi:phosphotransferase system enzyme I (PtsI)
MQTLHGIAVSPGVAIGEALVIGNEGFRIPRHYVVRDDVENEVQRFAVAVAGVAEEIQQNRDSVSQLLGEQYGAIFSAHLQMLQDTRLREKVESLIREKQYSTEHAVRETLEAYARIFRESDSSYLAERAHDIVDLEKGLLRHLLGHGREELSQLEAPVVVLAHNLTPSETANLDPKNVLGFVTEIGGAGGHTAIVAKGLEIPAVVGTGKILDDVSGGDTVIVDGDKGCVILQPDEDALAHYQVEVEHHRTLAAQLDEFREVACRTADGERIGLMANIEFPQEAAACLERGADGIGLYRTEFLYLGSKTEPSEEDHHDAYAQVVQAMEGRPVVIRTLDLGADKLGLETFDEEEEPNPFLGLRSIRLSLRNLPLFRTQLRAILRVSVQGNVQVMFPLITTLHELRQAKSVLEDAMQDLEERGLPFDRNIPVGMMVESPAAATMIDRFVAEVDFISIGTNDLIQYTMAVDRSNPNVAELYQATEPAVLRLIERSVHACIKAGVRSSLCGQMSDDPAYTMLLLGLGLRELSVPPSALLEIKRVCRTVRVAQCEQIAKRALTMDSAEQVERFLREELSKAIQ